MFLTESLRPQKIGRELVFSADLWYNGTNEKPLPLDALNLRGMGFALCLCNTKAQPAIKRNDKKNLMEVSSVLFKHPFLNLNMGLVKENFVITKKDDKNFWKARGFKKIRKYPIFRYKPNSSEIIMLGVPLSIEAFGNEVLKNSHIVDVCTYCGTYGMGGPGFFGLKLQGEYGTRWLTYCIWSAGEHILFDDHVLECHPDHAEKYAPLIVFDDYANSLSKFKELLSDMTIKEVALSQESIEIMLVDSSDKLHYIKSYKCSDQFPEQGGTGKKRNSFEDGKMSDYWLVTYDETHLKV